MATISTSTTTGSTLLGTSSDDTILGNSGADLLDGGAGNDFLKGGTNSDTYRFGRESGTDTISESYDTSAHTDVVLLDAGITPADVTIKRDGSSDTLLVRINGSTSVLRIEKYFYQDGSSPYALEQIRFADGTIWDRAAVKLMVLQSTSGNDTIVGYGTNDVLDGGAGNDRLEGGKGSDTYKFGRLSGNDTISESYDTSPHADTILLDAGIAPADVTFRRDGTSDDLLLRINGSSNYLRIERYFSDNGTSPYTVELIKFACGCVWNQDRVKAMALQSTSGNDTLVGYASNDLMDGGAGNDWLDGAKGSDTYKFGRLSGNDTISEGYDANPNTDTVLLDAGINVADVTVKRDGTSTDLLLRINGASNYLRIDKYFYNDGASPYALEQIKFADGTIWDQATVKAMVLQSTSGNDTLVGYGTNDLMDGGAGNDWLDGAKGSDTYKFGRLSGNDTISEGYDANPNTDTVLLDAGINVADVTVKRDGTSTDLLLRINGSSNYLRIDKYFYNDGASPYALEQIKFADGTIWDQATVKAMVLQSTSGNDTLVGYGTNDLMDGGAGNDWLDGAKGSDTYKFGRLSGNDTISEGYDANPNTDTVLLDADINVADVTVKRDGTSTDLLLRINGSSNYLRIDKYFYNDGASPYALEQIKFADGTIWDRATVKAMVLQSTSGNDTLVGYGTNDLMDGGAGNDWLDGAKGSDTYKFGRLSGNDTISEGYDANPNTDTVQLDADINVVDVTVKRDGTSTDLLLRINGSSNYLRIDKYFYNDGASPYALEQIKFADGTIWTYATVKTMLAQSAPVSFASMSGASNALAFTTEGEQPYAIGEAVPGDMVQLSGVADLLAFY